MDDFTKMESSDTGENGSSKYHQANPEPMSEDAKQKDRYFAKKRPPSESPSLVVGLRVDESACMSAFGRLEAAKRAVLAVYEFCQICHIPILIYGDTGFFQAGANVDLCLYRF
jgi:nitric oxide reductase NorD protein